MLGIVFALFVCFLLALPILLILSFFGFFSTQFLSVLLMPIFAVIFILNALLKKIGFFVKSDDSSIRQTSLSPESFKPLKIDEMASKLSVQSQVNKSVSSPSRNSSIPFAADGSFFHRGLIRSGGYTVGAKGCEHKFTNYYDALNYLRNMEVAKWRRPNAVGNWGIVSATKWDVLK